MNAFAREAAEPDYAAARKRMVIEQLAGRGRDIKNSAVLAAMGSVPRHEFLPASLQAHAYEDHAIEIGYEQTISQPFIVALMTERLNLKPTDKILEIGTGCGYQAAVLSKLAAEVYTIEIIEALGRKAISDLRRLGFSNVHVRIGDGYEGWPGAGPFDAVVVSCSPDHIPPALEEQLKEGGRMMIPVGTQGSQELYLLTKHHGKIEKRSVLPVRFVPMTGQAEEGGLSPWREPE